MDLTLDAPGHLDGVYAALRPLLLSTAYDIVGAIGESKDIVQKAYRSFVDDHFSDSSLGRFRSTMERKTRPVSLGVPLVWPLRSRGQAPEADALSTELQARGPR